MNAYQVMDLIGGAVVIAVAFSGVSAVFVGAIKLIVDVAWDRWAF
jgi:hypothetical protein